MENCASIARSSATSVLGDCDDLSLAVVGDDDELMTTYHTVGLL